MDNTTDNSAERLLGTAPHSIWRLARADPEQVAALAGALDVPLLVARLLVSRGIAEPDAARRFLAPSLDDLHDPYCLPDVDRAVDRLAAALERRERIFVHGDYDADGVTSAALCLRALSALGADVVGFVPRRSDGYDLQAAGVERARETGARLILTADCGIGALAAVAHAGALGLDVVITDHHRPGPELPAAVAVVNPYRDGCEAPFKHLCGAGVAFKVLDALVARIAPQHRASFRRNMADLVALGTVADVTPLTGENRILVAHGLRTLALGKKPGLRALLVSTDLLGKPLSAENIAWKLGPRLNAAGRMEDADLAYRLLTTRDEDEAEQLAVQLGALADRSREETSRVTTEALVEALLPEHQGRRVLVLARERWGKGVVGVAAARIVEQCRRPVILLSYDSETDHWHGSARSYGDFNLHQAFHACAELLGRFGGHSLSAGVSLPAANLAAFRDRLHALAEGVISDEPLVPTLDVDAEADGSEWRFEMIEQLERLAPFGRENPEPVFATRGAIALDPRRMGREGATFGTYLRLPGAAAPLKAVWFKNGDWADRLTTGDEVDVAYTPRINQWRGSASVELMLHDIHPAHAPANAVK
jgi:single-stranded-DNA-specific exonuclease